MLETHLKVISVLSVFGVVLGAWYMLWLVQRVFFGPLNEPAIDHAHAHPGTPDSTTSASPAPTHAHAANHAGAGGHASDPHGHDAHGSTASPLPHSSVRDLSLREVLCVAPLVVFMVWIGLDPDFFTSRMRVALDPVALAASERFEDYYNGAAPGQSEDKSEATASRPRTAPQPVMRSGVPPAPLPPGVQPADTSAAADGAPAREVARVR